VIKAVCDLRKLETPFDSIVCCGVSGLLVAPQVAEILNKNLVIIRKPDERRYSEFLMEGVTPYMYVVLDDLICSGDTFKWIKHTIYDECPKAKCVGLYCYLPEECAYTEKTTNLFYERYRTQLLNPGPART
jgi:orotate phosphoribosyltransferase-like protein